MLFNVLNSLHIHTCLCMCRAYTRNGEHGCDIQLKRQKKLWEGASSNKKGHKVNFLKWFLRGNVANIAHNLVLEYAFV